MMERHDRSFRLLLQTVRTVVLLAVITMVMPYSWMKDVHQWVGMGTEPIVRYRSVHIGVLCHPCCGLPISSAHHQGDRIQSKGENHRIHRQANTQSVDYYSFCGSLLSQSDPQVALCVTSDPQSYYSTPIHYWESTCEDNQGHT